MGLSLSFLGAFDVAWKGRSLEFATSAARALFAYLAVESDRPHAREHLAALLWPDHSQAAASASLRTTLSRLRKALPDVSSPIAQNAKFALQFSPEVATTDVAQFERLLAECAAHPHTPAGAAVRSREQTREQMIGCADCVQRLEQAAALYRGEFLNGLSLDHSATFEEWKLLRREQLHAQALDALETLTRYHHGAGDYERMRVMAARQLTLEPWREVAHGQLMHALAQVGRRSDALLQFDVCQRVLRDELGIEPGTELRELAERIRVGGLTVMTLAPQAPDERAKPIAPPPHNLPETFNLFIGREGELADIAAALAQPEVRLLTLAGPGGMGKTRLALEAARVALTPQPLTRRNGQPHDDDRVALPSDFPDGIWFVSLVGIGAATPALGQALAGAASQAMGLAAPDRGAADAHLLAHVRSRRMLLILDNAEHLLQTREGEQAFARFVTATLSAAPGVKMLITSRELLRLEAERVVRLHGLNVTPADAQAGGLNDGRSDSVRLLLHHAHRAGSKLVVDDETLRGATELCRLLDGMPLEIVLAASLTPHFTCDEIAQAIRHNLDVLTSDRRDIPARHRGLRAVFERTWALLSRDERRVLAQLSLFTGAFSRSSAMAVTQAGLSQLAALTDKSLLRTISTGRYEMHELLRQFAAEKLATLDGQLASAVRQRFTAHYLTMIGARTPDLLGRRSAAAVNDIQREIENIRGAWHMAGASPSLDANTSAMIHALVGLSTYWLVTGRFAEGEALLTPTLEKIATPAESACDDTHLPGRRSLLIGLQLALADCLLGQDKIEHALKAAEMAVSLAATSGDGDGDARQRAHGLLIIARGLVFEQGHIVKAQPFWREGHALAEQGGWRDLLAEAYLMRAYDCDDIEDRVSFMMQALHMAQTLGNTYLEFRYTKYLANICADAGHYTQALLHLSQCLRLAQESQDPTRISDVFILCGLNYLWLGAYVEAITHLDQAVVIAQQHSLTWREEWALFGLSLAHLGLGELDAAMDDIERARDIARQSREPELRLDHTLGLILTARGALVEAEAIFRRLVAAIRALDSASTMKLLPNLTWLAHLLHRRGANQAALTCVEEMLAILAAHSRLSMHYTYEDPHRIYWVCYQVLSRASDARAPQVLNAGYHHLQTQAASITNDTLRQSFLQDVPANRALAEAWRAAQDDQR